MAVQVGSPAPKFKAKAYFRTADNTDNQFKVVTLDEYKDKWLCMYFYPKDFTFVCPTEIVAFDKALGDFKDRNCEVLAVSTDSEFVHKGWCDSHNDLKKLRHPMLADITKRVSMDYGLLIPDEGVALRGTFLIDPNGVVRWVNVNDLSVGRNIDEVLRVLDALQTDELCPCNWKKGQETIKV